MRDVRCVVRLIIVLSLLSVVQLPARAGEPGTVVAPYLLDDFGAIGAAMGGAGTGGPADAEAIHYNPAALGRIERKRLTLHHSEELTGDNAEMIHYVHPVGERLGLGISAIFLHFTDAIRTEFSTTDQFTNYDLALGLSAGYRVTSSLLVGGTVRFLKERLYIYDANDVAGDIGAMWETPVSGLSLGYAVKNMGRGLSFKGTRYPLPLAHRAGVAWRSPGGAWSAKGDLMWVKENRLRIGYGLERRIGRYLSLRAGYRHNHDGRRAASPTAGLSISYDDLAFDYAYLPASGYHEIASTHRIQTTIAFGSPRRAPAPPAASATGSSKWRGTYTLTNRYVDIDNQRIIGFVPGWTPRLDLFAVGAVGDLEATIGVSAYHDAWDGFTVRRATAAFRGEAIRMTAGDFIATMSPFTISGREMRGAEATLALTRPLPTVAAPTADELRGLAGEDFNVGRYLRQSGLGREAFRSVAIRTMAGRTASPVNVGDEIEGLNRVRATYGIYEQFAYGAEIVSEVLPNTEITLRAAHVADDPNSLHSPGVTRPIENTVLALAFDRRFPSTRTSLDGEIAYSLYDLNTSSTEEMTRNDLAWFTRARWSPASWVIEALYEEIGPRFDLGGNLGIRSVRDRSGPRLNIEAPLHPRLTLRFDGRWYRDNLDGQKPYTTTTLDLTPSADINLPLGATLTLGYNARADRSGRSRDTASVIQEVNSLSQMTRASLRMPFKSWAWLLYTSDATYENENLYLPGITVGGYRISTYGGHLTGGLTKRTDFMIGYNLTRTRFEVPISVSEYEQYSGRFNVRDLLDKKLHLFLAGRLDLARGATQRQARTEKGGGGRYAISTDKTADFEYKRVTDRYAPMDPLLGFTADQFELRYTGLF
jgi:hypothetical protein